VRRRPRALDRLHRELRAARLDHVGLLRIRNEERGPVRTILVPMTGPTLTVALEQRADDLDRRRRRDRTLEGQPDEVHPGQAVRRATWIARRVDGGVAG